MSQVTKLTKIPSQYDEIRKSVTELADDIKKDVADRDVIGAFAVVITADGEYAVYQSDGIKRHQKVGILMEMAHDLLHQVR